MMNPSTTIVPSESNRSLAAGVAGALGLLGLWNAASLLRVLPALINSFTDEVFWAPRGVGVGDLLRLVAFVAMFVWLYRETARAVSAGHTGLGSAGGAVALWFVPFAGFFLGPGRIDALRRASVPRASRSPLVALAGVGLLLGALGMVAFAGMTAPGSITFKPFLIVTARVLEGVGMIAGCFSLAGLVMNASRAADGTAR